MGAIKQSDLFDRPEEVAAAYKKAKGSVLVVCPTHKEIARVTRAVRADLIRDNKLGEETRLHRLEPLNWTDAQKRDVRNFEPGQMLVFHKGTKEARKYEAFTIPSDDGQIVQAQGAQGREIQLTKKQAKCFGGFEKRDIAVAPGDWLSIQSNLRDARISSPSASGSRSRPSTNRAALSSKTNAPCPTTSGSSRTVTPSPRTNRKGRRSMKSSSPETE
jgi:hypothetical protein